MKLTESLGSHSANAISYKKLPKAFYKRTCDMQNLEHIDNDHISIFSCSFFKSLFNICVEVILNLNGK